MKVVFLCPFKLDRLTGTPIRAVATIKAALPLFEEVYVITTSNTGIITTLRNVKFHHLSTKFRSPYFWYKSMSLLLQINPDVVHIITTMGVIPSIIVKKISSKCNIVFEMHGILKYEAKMLELGLFYENLLNIIDRMGTCGSSVVITVSHTMKKLLIKQGIDSEKIHVIWGPVEITPGDEYERTRIRHIFGVEDKTVFGYFGNDAPWQGIENIFKASEHLLTQTDKASFFFGGISPEKYQHLHHKNRVFLGVIPRSRIFSYMKACDVLLSTRHKTLAAHHQYPHKLSEYLACGRVVIGTNVGDQARVLNASNSGIVIPPGDPFALYKAMLEVMSTSQKDLIKKGENSENFVKKELSIEATTKKLIAVYKNAIS